jgi:hypothetical protein
MRAEMVSQAVALGDSWGLLSKVSAWSMGALHPV